MFKGTAELVECRREEIINACEYLCQTMSYSDMTLKEISKVTTFSRPTIYNYFQSKEEIFLALINREFDRWNIELQNIMSDNMGMTTEELADKLAHSLDNRRLLLKLLAVSVPALEGSGEDERRGFFRNFFGRSQDLILRLLDMTCPWLPSGVQEELTQAFFSFIFGLDSISEIFESQKDLLDREGMDCMYQTVYSLTYNFVIGLLRASDVHRIASEKGRKGIKTKVNRICDYHDIPIGPFKDTIPEMELRDEMKNEIKKDLLQTRVIKEVTDAEPGDMAELRLRSNQPKFNKDNIRINLGLGLFSKELEAGIIGHRTGDAFHLVIGGCTVKGEIISLKRKSTPELNDAFAESLGIPGVTTKNEYLAHIRAKYIDLFTDGYLECHAQDLFDETMARSDIEYSDEDIRLFIKDPDMAIDEDSVELEDARFILNLCLWDCVNRGIDYRTMDTEFSIRELTDLRDRVLKPFKEFLADKCEFVITEE